MEPEISAEFTVTFHSDGHETIQAFILLYFRTGISPHKTPSKPVSTPLEGAMI